MNVINSGNIRKIYKFSESKSKYFSKIQTEFFCNDHFTLLERGLKVMHFRVCFKNLKLCFQLFQKDLDSTFCIKRALSFSKNSRPSKCAKDELT